MNNIFQKIYNLIPKKLKGIYGILGIVVLVLVVFLILRPAKQTQFEYQTVEKTTFTTRAEGSGYVTTEKEVDLKPLSTGQINTVKVKPGDFVRRGQILATLDGRSASIQIAQAKANYDKVVNGSTNTDIQISKTALDNATNTLETVKKQQESLVTNARKALLNSSITAQSTYDTSQNNIPIISGTYTCDKEGTYTINLYGTGSGYYASVSGLESGTFSFSTYGKAEALGSWGLYVAADSSKTYTGSEQWTIRIPNTRSVNYLTNYNNYISAQETRDKTISDAQQNVKTAQANLDQKIAQTRPEDIASYKASLDSAYLAYDNTLIKAPFDGQIGTVPVQIGQHVSSNDTIATLVTKSKIAEISLNEVDIANTKIGQKVDLTFDAINDLKLQGTVSEIDTLGTEDQNVVTFKVKISFDNDDEKVRPGMSVTGSIVTFEKKDTILVSNTALKSEGGKYYVEVLDSASTDTKNPNKKIFITTGLSNDTETEITSGLSGNEKIVYRIVESKGSAPAKGLIQPPSGEN